MPQKASRTSVYRRSPSWRVLPQDCDAIVFTVVLVVCIYIYIYRCAYIDVAYVDCCAHPCGHHIL